MKRGGRVIVFGSAGFIGRAVALAFSARGERVLGVSRHGADAGIEATSITRFFADLDRHLSSCRCLVYACGSGSVARSAAAPADDFRASVAYPAAILARARAIGSDARFVYCSSAAVFGNVDSGRIDDATPVAPRSKYALIRAAAEALITASIEGSSVTAVVLRLFSVYGPGLAKQLFWDACRKIDAADDRYFGCGTELRDWVYIDDIIDLVASVDALQLAPGTVETYCSGRGVAVSVADALHALYRIRGCRRRPEFSGETLVDYPTVLVADETVRRPAGWSPAIDLDSGLGRYCHWYGQFRG